MPAMLMSDSPISCYRPIFDIRFFISDEVLLFIEMDSVWYKSIWTTSGISLNPGLDPWQVSDLRLEISVN